MSYEKLLCDIISERLSEGVPGERISLAFGCAVAMLPSNLRLREGFSENVRRSIEGRAIENLRKKFDDLKNPDYTREQVRELLSRPFGLSKNSIEVVLLTSMEKGVFDEVYDRVRVGSESYKESMLDSIPSHSLYGCWNRKVEYRRVVSEILRGL